MAKILMGWELGHGFGHIVPLRKMAEAFITRGHQPVFIVRDVGTAEKALAGLNVDWFQAPLVRYMPWELTRTDCYSQLLGNIGFREPKKLSASVRGWLDLMRAIQPDAAQLDFAPSAMLACRILGIPYAIQGPGFFCPPPEQTPFGVMNAKMPVVDRIEQDNLLLETLNHFLESQHAPRLPGLATLYADARATVLTTFAELDHFPARTNPIYSGVWLNRGGAAPIWPQGKGEAKIFAYLSPQPGTQNVLKMLAGSGVATLVYCAGLDKAARAPYESASCRFLDELVDLEQVAAEASLAVLNANHSTTATFLLSGVPTLQIPLYMEHVLMAKRLKQAGMAEVATLDQPHRIAAALNAMLTQPNYRTHAGGFARRYQHVDMQQARDEAADRCLASLFT